MCASGVPTDEPQHAENIVFFALGCLAFTEMYNAELAEGSPGPIQWRIGCHSGDVTSAVVGRSRFLYDVYGDNVNIAARIESSSAPGRIRVSSSLRNCVTCDALEFSGVDSIRVKGKDAPIDVHWVQTEPDETHVLSQFQRPSSGHHLRSCD